MTSPCSAVFDGEVCGDDVTCVYHNYGKDGCTHEPFDSCHPYQEKESPMLKKFVFDMSPYNDIIIRQNFKAVGEPVATYSMEIKNGYHTKITPKALREIADTLEKDTDIIRKTITL